MISKTIGMILIATNKYVFFVESLINSADLHFLPEEDVEYIIFTDNPIKIKSKRKTNFIKINHEPWPAPTLKRYDYFNQYSEYLKSFKYLFYCDVDMKFVAPVNNEIFGNLVATQHPGFINANNHQFTYERNPASMAYIPAGQGNQYYAGGFNGGISSHFLLMANTITKWRQKDELQNIIPVWHDESYMNKYMFETPPTVVLSPSYCYPEGDNYNLPFKKILLALNKDHQTFRS